MSKTSTRHGPRLRRSVVLGVLALGIAAIAVASATQLSVTSNDLQVEKETRCDDGVLSVTVEAAGPAGPQRSAVVSGYGSACNGLEFFVAVEHNNGSIIGEGTATCGPSPCTIVTDRYNGRRVVDAHVMIDTWGVPADWTATCYNPPGPVRWQCVP